MPAIGRALRALLGSWLVLDFFGESRRSGQRSGGSSLTSTIFGQSFLALVLAALLVDERIGVTAYTAANLSLSTILAGLGAAASPTRADRRAANRLLLATAPLPRAVLPMARGLHGTLQLAMITIGIALPPAILSRHTVGGSWAGVPLYLSLAVVCAAVLAGMLDVVVRLVGRLAGPLQAGLAAGLLRALLLGGAFVGFALGIPHLDETVDALPGGPTAAWLWPPYHAARLMNGHLDGLAILLGVGLVLAAFAALLGEPEANAARRHPPRSGPFVWLTRALAPSGPLRGCTEYTGTMLYRSASFRARVLPLAGLPMAMVLLAFGQPDPREQLMLLGVVLQFPAIYTPFLAAFLPFTERAGARELFGTAPDFDLHTARVAATLAVSVRIHLPILVAGCAAALALGFEPLPVLGLLGSSWALATVAVRIGLRTLQDPPFTAAKETTPAIDHGGLMAGAVVLAGLGGVLAATFARWPWLGLAGLGAAGVAVWGLSRLASDAAGRARETRPA